MVMNEIDDLETIDIDNNHGVCLSGLPSMRNPVSWPPLLSLLYISIQFSSLQITEQRYGPYKANQDIFWIFNIKYKY